MHILIVNNTQIPAPLYGGTERVIWWLGKELVKKKHRVTYLVKEGSKCDFAHIIAYNPELPLANQIPADVDLVHLQFLHHGELPKPAITTIHGNLPYGIDLPLNSVFVSKNHAERYGSSVFVHNGLDFSDYGDPGLHNKRNYFHFLGKAAWRVKNLRGAIDIISKADEKMVVVGGHRLNFKMGFRFTPNLNIRFRGMLGGEDKNEVIRHSKGLLFPVLWHEPFGIAITESLYFGCPVFGTPYGSLPELITDEVGFLSASKAELTEAIQTKSFDPKICHEYAVEYFGTDKMANNYLDLYEKVLNNEALNPIHPTLQQQTEKFLPFS